MSHEIPRIVFLGMPGSGKTALLGALAQAAQTQDQLLGSRLRAEQLEPLQKFVYESSSEPEQAEIAAFSATLEPIKDQHGPRGEALFLDCDGELAADFLKQSDPFKAPAGQAVGKEVVAADTVVLTVDFAADVPQLKQAFNQFIRLLQQLETQRSVGAEVTGLPVYLVLTKCDLLAKKTDASSNWVSRVEERKRVVGERFKEFLARTLPENRAAFGKIELHLWATAVGRPGFSDSPAHPREPYGVAELFHECLISARRFHLRRRRSSQMLQALVAASCGLVAFLLLLAGVFFATRPDSELDALEYEVQSLVPGKDDKPSLRFKEPLQDKIEKLTQLASSPAFVRLPKNRRDEVAAYLAEVTAYHRFDRDLLAKVPEPRFATSDLDLQTVDAGLRNLHLQTEPYLDLGKVDAALATVELRLRKPADTPSPKLDGDALMKSLHEVLAEEQYASPWVETRATRRYCQYRFDTHVFQRARQEALAWFREQTKEGRRLDNEANDLMAKLGQIVIGEITSTDQIEHIKNKVADWQDRCNRYRERPNKYRENERGDDITFERFPGSLTLRYGMIPNMTSRLPQQSVFKAQTDLEVVKQNLEGQYEKVLKKRAEISK